MLNVEMKVENNILTLRVDLGEDFGRTKSGKTNIIGTSNGFQPVEDGKGTIFSLNVNRKI